MLSAFAVKNEFLSKSGGVDVGVVGEKDAAEAVEVGHHRQRKRQVSVGWGVDRGGVNQRFRA